MGGKNEKCWRLVTAVGQKLPLQKLFHRNYRFFRGKFSDELGITSSWDPLPLSQAAACDGLSYSANYNGHKQMLTALNLFAVLYLNLIGQNKYSCQNFDQATALLECGQNWSQGPNFDHFAQNEWSLLNKRRITAN